MAGRFMGRQGRTKLGDGHDSSGRSDVHTELPVHENQQEGGRGGDTDIRRLAKFVNSFTGVPDGHGSDERAGTDSDPANSHDGGGLPADGNGNGGDNSGSEEGSLFGLKIALGPEQSYVQNRYRGPAEEAATGLAEARIRNRDGVLIHPAEDYERLFSKAIAAQEEILDMELPDVESEHFGRVLGAKASTAQAVINSGLKADENRLRQQKSEVLHELYARHKAIKEGKTIEGQATLLP